MTVPTGTVQDVLDWVDGDPGRAQEALDAEYEGQNRTTLISQLEAIASTTQEDSSMSAGANETLPVEGDADALAPGPEQPSEVVIYASDPGTTVGVVHVRDENVEIPDGVLTPLIVPPDEEPEPIDAEQVEYLQAAVASNGMILSLNGANYALTSNLVGALKQAVEKAIAATSF